MAITLIVFQIANCVFVYHSVFENKRNAMQLSDTEEYAGETHNEVTYEPKFLNIEVFYLLFALLFVGASAVISFWIWHNLTKTDKVSTMCFDMLKEQDFAAQLRHVGYPEGDRMIDIYNRMIGEMKEQRLKLLGTNEAFAKLIDVSPMGIVIMDFDRTIITVNTAAARFLKIPAAELTGHRIEEFDNALARTLSSLSDDAPQKVEKIDGINRYRCSLLSFYDRGSRRPFILIEELTLELIAAEKQAAEKIIRTMSHEVNNTLGSINSNISVLMSFEDIFPDDLRSDIIRALQLSIERSDNLCRLVASFAEFVKLPPPSVSPVTLHDIVKNTVYLMQGKFAEAGIKCTLQLCRMSPIITADVVQIEQALINILKNAIEASIGKGDEVQVITTYNPSTLTVRDTGCGVTEEIRDKLFTPFFTTKPGGQGIGLMLVCEILLNHRFKFDLRTKDGFTDFRIEF